MHFFIPEHHNPEHIRTALSNAGITPDQEGITSLNSLKDIKNSLKIILFDENTDENPESFLSAGIDSIASLYVDMGISDWPRRLADRLPANSLELEKYIKILLSTKRAYEEDWIRPFQNMLEKHFRFSETFTQNFGIVAHELLMNAILHGNLKTDFPLDKEHADFLDACQKISSCLKEPELGGLPLSLTLTLAPPHLRICIEDEGPGVRFEDFIHKYKDKIFTKGFDYILHIADKIECCPFSGRITVSMSEKHGKIVLPEDAKDGFSTDIIAVMTEAPALFEEMRNKLNALGYTRARHVLPRIEFIEDITEHSSAMIILADVPYDKISGQLRSLRQHHDKKEFSILYQTPPPSAPGSHTDFFRNVNEVLPLSFTLYELSARLGVQIDMRHARKKLDTSYKNYQEEFGKTIHILEEVEKQHSIHITGKGGQTFAVIHSFGTQTQEIRPTSPSTQHRNEGSGWYFQTIPFPDGKSLKLAAIAINKTGFTPALLFSKTKAQMSDFFEDHEIGTPIVNDILGRAVASLISPDTTFKECHFCTCTLGEDRLCMRTLDRFLIMLVSYFPDEREIRLDPVDRAYYTNGTPFCQSISRKGTYLITPDTDLDIRKIPCPAPFSIKTLAQKFGRPFIAIEILKDGLKGVSAEDRRPERLCIDEQ